MCVHYIHGGRRISQEVPQTPENRRRDRARSQQESHGGPGIGPDIGRDIGPDIGRQPGQESTEIKKIEVKNDLKIDDDRTHDCAAIPGLGVAIMSR